MPRYGPATALLVVDYQNDFAVPGGSLSVAGAERLLRALNEEIGLARAGGSPVFYTQDWHPPVTPHFQKDGGVWPVHCVAGTWGAELVAGLDVAGPIVRKGVNGEDGYSAFSVRDPQGGETGSTGLAEQLQELGVRRLVLAGLATDYCVKESVLDARRLGFEVIVRGALIGAVDLRPGDGQDALAVMTAAGAEVA